MVRVIPVHNFLEQNASQIEEPTAICIACLGDGREVVLLSLASHCVEVRDLTLSNLQYITTFPTVDLVTKMVHCMKGNYVATLETKVPEENAHSSRFVRIYIDWGKPDQQPMRARIAGRVTPSLINKPQNILEMIELPLTVQPTSIACCQSTGNLLVATGNTLILHEFKLETHSISKLKFIDFEARPWSLGLHFSPTHLQIVEDFISAGDALRYTLFQLYNPLYNDLDDLSSFTSTTSSNDKTTISTDFCSMDNTMDRQKGSVDKNSNVQKASSEPKRDRKKNCINWNQITINEKTEIDALINKGVVDHKSKPITIDLPSICLERASPGHTLSPFILNSSDTEVFVKTNSPDEGWSENYVIKNILRLKIGKAQHGSKVDGGEENLTNFVLKPLYLKTSNNMSGVKRSILKSEKYRYLNGITCLVCTVQEGYLYHFSLKNCNKTPTCLTAYQFTAPLINVALEYTILHALTEAGLESYTLRLSHHIAKNLKNPHDQTKVCPDIAEPVCLIGLRPYQGIYKLFSTDNFIILLSQIENSWMLHSLRLPKPENAYYDIINAAKNHRLTSPSTYLHLLEEAHSILRLAKDIIYLNDSSVKNDQKLEFLLNQSCALMADHYVKSESVAEQKLCIPYYKMSGLRPNEVLARKSAQNTPGLVLYVKDVLLNIKKAEADALFQCKDLIVEIIDSEDVESICKLVLGSIFLREYATDKIIKLLESKMQTESTELCLGLLYIQEEKRIFADEMIRYIPDKFLQQTLIDYPSLLFDEITNVSKKHAILSFSDFSTILISLKSAVFTKVLAHMVQNEALSLHQVVQMFLEYIPSRIGKDGQDAAETMQLFLETYLKNYFCDVQEKEDVSYNYVLIEVFKILIRSYLGKMMHSKKYNVEEAVKNEDWKGEDSYLFENQRPKYLDKMPPCSSTDEQKSKNYLCNFDNFNKYYNDESRKNVMSEVLKLQALLASVYLPAECIQEVEHFLETEEVEGSLALQTLCNRDTETVTQMLIEKCPEAVLQYAKDMYTKENEWKILLELCHQKLAEANSSQEAQTFFEHLIIEVIKHAAEVLPVKSLDVILSRDSENFQKYVDIWGQVVQAEQVKSLLMETGRKILSSLNL